MSKQNKITTIKNTKFNDNDSSKESYLNNFLSSPYNRNYKK